MLYSKDFCERNMKMPLLLCISGNQPSLQCIDHDYHLAGIVSSVCLNVDIPESPRDLFYKGTIHVTIKDKVFQPSKSSTPCSRES
ncbi:hypothetical protein MAR_009239 [Mya arenaria]|uniref:Recombination activating protein 2 n=1 Tax=Mya arenaria TaxID=6604 RepID=A0ABY7E695_MYAAR|nr:hypothetical protein MAR_009239 [Mya arenaria]